MGHFEVSFGFLPYDKAKSDGRIRRGLNIQTTAEAFQKARHVADSISLIVYRQIHLLWQPVKK